MQINTEEAMAWKVPNVAIIRQEMVEYLESSAEWAVFYEMTDRRIHDYAKEFMEKCRADGVDWREAKGEVIRALVTEIRENAAW